MIGELQSHFFLYYSFIYQIAFVPDEDDPDVFVSIVFHFLQPLPYILKTLQICDVKHQEGHNRADSIQNYFL
jgi:hypothetical protein